MLKKLIVVVILLSTASVYAGPFDLFLVTLKKDFYFTKTDKGNELNQHVYVTKFGPLGRIFNRDAIATYNDKLNMISLDETFLDGGMIKSSHEIMGPNFDSSKISTIFHEMGHGELDTLIENEFDTEDMILNSYYKNTLKAFYKTHYPGFNPHMMFHEHFGYYRGELIEFIASEVNEVLTQNGFNRFQNRCFLSFGLKQKLAEGIALEDYLNLFNFQAKDEFYRLKIGPKYIFVRGKDIDLGTAPQGMVAQTHLMFWSYHQAGYNFPMTRSDLVTRMNQSKQYVRSLTGCRTKQWQDYHQ
jgi:hypothetical protein